VFFSAGLFGVAVSVSFRWLLYLGVLSMLAAILLTVLGLIRELRTGARVGSEVQGR
jgi:ABC-type protease/lipase transport system fused ATPase/permease subunit